MSDPNLDDLRHDYRFKLGPANRCESCLHATGRQRAIRTFQGRCSLLGIHIENVRTSSCPGWQSAWPRTKP